MGKSTFDAAAKRLTDITYLFEDVQVFSSSFLNCLNNQTMNQTAFASVANIAILIYQLQTRIETGFQEKLAGAATELGAAFGQPVQDSINEIAGNFVTEFTKVGDYLSVILDDVRAVADAKEAVTASDISADAMSGLVIVFKDIYVSCQQIDSLITNLVIVSKTLDAVVTQTQAAQQNATGTIAKASYQLDVAVQAANNMFAKNMITFQTSITDSFAAFQSLAATVFGNDIDVLFERNQVESNLASFFSFVETSFAGRFPVLFSTFFAIITDATNKLKTQTQANTQQVVDYFTGLAATSGGAIATCLGPSRQAAVKAMKIIQAMGTDTAKCLAVQQNYLLSAQSLLNFIAQDVILNMQGAADTLCGCTVGGGKKDKDISLACIRNVGLSTESTIFIKFNLFTG